MAPLTLKYAANKLVIAIHKIAIIDSVEAGNIKVIDINPSLDNVSPTLFTSNQLN